MNHHPPIPSPDPESKSLIFRARFMSYFSIISITALALSLPLVILRMLPISSSRAFLFVLAFAIVVGLGTCGLITFVLIQLYPVVMDAKELRSTNVWGRSVSVKWPEIVSVKRTSFLALPYLKITTPEKKNLMWLPLFLSDLNGFRAAVAQHAAPDNPLRKVLEC